MSEVLSMWRGVIDNGEPARPRRSMAEIAAQIAELHDLTVHDLKAYNRTRRFAHARQHAMAEMHATGLYSQPQIGRFLGGRDPSTIHHGIWAHRKRALSQETPASFPARAQGPILGEAQLECA